MDDALFSAGYDVPTYLANLRNYRSFVRALVDEARVEPEHVKALAAATRDRPQPVRATMMTEDWCGDSACNLPILAPLFEQAGIPFRVIRGSEQPALKEGYEGEGVDHIPVVSLWDGDGAELARWVEAPVAVSSKKDQWKAERPHFMELYRKQKEDKEAAKQFAALYRELLDAMAEWYRSGMWNETTREIVAAVRAAE